MLGRSVAEDLGFRIDEPLRVASASLDGAFEDTTAFIQAIANSKEHHPICRGSVGFQTELLWPELGRVQSRKHCQTSVLVQRLYTNYTATAIGE